MNCRIDQITNRALVLSVALLGFAIGGCSTPTPTALPANEVIAQAAQNFGAVQSLHFVIDFSGSPTYLDAAHTMILRHIEGDVVRPGRMRALLKVSLPVSLFKSRRSG